MYIPKIRQIITPNCRIHIPKAEKSLPARAKKVQALSDAFQKKILLIEDKTLSLQELHKIILDNKELSNVALDIVPKHASGCYACLGTDVTIKESALKELDADLTYDRFVMQFIEKDGIVQNPNGEIVHEVRHLYDNLYNPKYVLMRNLGERTHSCYRDKFVEVHNFILNPNVYKPRKVLGILKKHSFETELREKLKGLENNVVIGLLQQCRNKVQLELNAYDDYLKYYLRFLQYQPDLIFPIMKYYRNHCNEFEFPEKMRVIRKLIKEFIDKERMVTKSE